MFNRGKERHNSGTISKSELLHLESNLINYKQRELNSKNAVDIALLNLKQKIQVKNKNFDIEEVDSTLRIANNKLLEEKVLKNKIDKQHTIIKAKIDIENTEIKIENAKTKWYPRITAVSSKKTNYGYNLGLSNKLNQIKFTKQLKNNIGYGIGVNINMPILTDIKIKTISINK